ncbi:semaphorin-7A [Trichomycterus rosablanca]|uniref:semaphorin-7A n=1 Tax=Trichomycterus rosablanca TaxID=2290929 RepID=UPI002F3580C0
MFIMKSAEEKHGHPTPRVIIPHKDGSFLTSNSGVKDLMKLIKDPVSTNLYAVGPQGLYVFQPGDKAPQLQLVRLPLYKNVCPVSSPDCRFNISLLTEGTNGTSLFICVTTGDQTNCCNMNSELSPEKCFDLPYLVQIKDPCLKIGEQLYLTVSHNDQSTVQGLYRCSPGGCTRPSANHIEQKHVKIIADKGSKSDGKLYTFYNEHNTNPDPDTPRWIPRISQICMADRGGTKAKLQFSWTSLLTARLFCGNKEERLVYTELLDVDVLEAEPWSNTLIYALFKNAYDLRAVCVYKMSDIIHVFSSNKFTESREEFSSPRPGECVPDSQKLPPKILNLMETRPVMQDWIEQDGEALLLSHHLYSHLQVNQVQGSGNGRQNVLLMGLESGQIHKILEQDGFIISEYQAFKNKTIITSMKLDRSTGALFVSSSSNVAQIDLQNCSVYKNQCSDCVFARDPYCRWNQDGCSSDGNSSQDTKETVCARGSPKTSQLKTSRSSLKVPRDSKYYLKCPKSSRHAAYSWYHDSEARECESTEQDCLLLIDGMRKADEGWYECKSTEDGYTATIEQLRLEMGRNGASQRSAAAVVLAPLLIMSWLIC